MPGAPARTHETDPLDDAFAQTIANFKLPDASLPPPEARFREVLSPASMVRTRVGIGAPQPPEVERMLGEAASTLRNDEAWMSRTRQKLKDADARLDKAFRALSG